MLRRASPAARRASSCFTPFAYATTPPTKTSLDPATDVSRAATIPPVHDSAVASRQSSRSTEREDVLLDRALVARVEPALDRRSERAPRARRRARPHPARRRGRRGSRSRARRSSPPPRRRRRPPLRVPARPRTRRRRRTAASRLPGGRVRARSARNASVSSAFGHSRCSSAGGPGQDDDHPPVAVRDEEARRGARHAERDRAVRDRRLLRHARARSRRTGAAAAPRPRARRLSILSSSSRSTRRPRPSARATISTVRSSWVGPSPPETRHASARTPSRSAASSSSAQSPTIAIRAGSRPSRSASRARNGPLQIGALAAHELAARDDDERPRARRRRAQPASAVRVGVTSTFSFLRAGSDTTLPLSVRRRCAGLHDTDPEALCRAPR